MSGVLRNPSTPKLIMAIELIKLQENLPGIGKFSINRITINETLKLWSRRDL
ncbi:MAG: hypothetical protein IZT55_05505 [Anaerolineae bacterium]|nr:hypothetical protein [Anaerolineae bacterium]